MNFSKQLSSCSFADRKVTFTLQYVTGKADATIYVLRFTALLKIAKVI